MIVLVDCNNFFVSCERVFRPDLKNKPVVVLSNNDGCIISRSNEAKKLGIKMGVPLFKAQNIIASNNVHVFSANFNLYCDFSKRVLSILKLFSNNIQHYSVDEAFLTINELNDFNQFAHQIYQTLKQWIDIPVSIGIAGTKTLSKIAGYLAKQKQYHASHNSCPQNNIVILDNEEKRIIALKQTPISEVWGIGHRISPSLAYQGIDTAYDLTQAPSNRIRNLYGINLLKTMQELTGIQCYKVENRDISSKSIIRSRSFGRKVTQLQELSNALATHISYGCRQLRKERLFASSIIIYIRANRFKANYLKKTKLVKLPFPTNDTRIFIQYGCQELKNIFLDGAIYDKCGVCFLDLSKNIYIQYDIFNKESSYENHNKSSRLMREMDRLNAKFKIDAVFIAECGIPNPTKLRPKDNEYAGLHKKEQRKLNHFASKSSMKSNNYTMDFLQLPVVLTGENFDG